MRFILILLAGLATMQAQEGVNTPAVPSIRVHGESTVSAEPDEAQFDIGVVTQAAGAKEASDQNAAQTKALIEELRALIPSGDIKTVNFSVNPN